MTRRRAALLAALVCAALAMSGCGGAPAPAETTPLFASEEEEAFAAAEATYRAYLDAVNARRAGNGGPTDPEDFLTADALRTEIEGDNLLKQSGLVIDGDTNLLVFKGGSSTATSVEAIVCLDGSGTRVIDSTGADVTPPDRDDTTSFDITFVADNGVFLIADSRTALESAC